jgi:hypothetical protein
VIGFIISPTVYLKTTNLYLKSLNNYDSVIPVKTGT